MLFRTILDTIDRIKTFVVYQQKGYKARSFHGWQEEMLCIKEQKDRSKMKQYLRILNGCAKAIRYCRIAFRSPERSGNYIWKRI